MPVATPGGPERSRLKSGDPFAALKARARETWTLGRYADLAVFTTPVAAHLVRFAGVRSGESVLDIGTGTGVVAITARLRGARVTGIDLTPELLDQARENAAIGEVADIDWQEGDVESLQFPDASFDVVLSQFGHMFAPRPEVATREMLRVLKPGGTIAFATWPPEQLDGRLSALATKYVPWPSDVARPILWGDVNVVRERLGDSVGDLVFERGIMGVPALSAHHVQKVAERRSANCVRMMQALEADRDLLASWWREWRAISAAYLRDNVLLHEYLLVKATRITVTVPRPSAKGD
jgi:SAM-dependent methyltransferase